MNVLIFLVLPLVCSLIVVAVVLRPLIVLVLRRRARRHSAAAVKVAGFKTRRARRWQHKHQDDWAAESPYAPTALSRELVSSVGVLLVLYGRLGVSAADLAEELDKLDTARAVRATARIKFLVDDLARDGCGDDWAATAWMIDLSDRFHLLHHTGRTRHQL